MSPSGHSPWQFAQTVVSGSNHSSCRPRPVAANRSRIRMNAARNTSVSITGRTSSRWRTKNSPIGSPSASMAAAVREIAAGSTDVVAGGAGERGAGGAGDVVAGGVSDVVAGGAGGRGAAAVRTRRSQR